jgi:uncharacterized protein (TIGR02680 family)
MNLHSLPLDSMENDSKLPLPAHNRWKPLRLGLVNIFHYDSEEFAFENGRLMLRGGNGTGKSKVLSLTMPFLFDAYVRPSRVEPDGDPTKKMSWNLLMGGKHDRRIGYSWIEFGCLDERGEAKYVTLGAGLSAAVSRPDTVSWFFVLDMKRIGHDIWLDRQRSVLTKEKLREALGEHGRIFDAASAYRVAVDERLFHLGPARYASLIDTLIQLRMPQLSKHPDEVRLSNALSEALPPIPNNLLNDVAEALNQLEEDRVQLEKFEHLNEAVGKFERGYRQFAVAQTRLQAGAVRGSATVFDNASSQVNEAREHLVQTQKGLSAVQQRVGETERDLIMSRARVSTLLDDPANKDASDLVAAGKHVDDKQAAADHAGKLARDAQRRLDTEAAAEKTQALRNVELWQALQKQRVVASEASSAAGISGDCDAHAFLKADAEAIGSLTKSQFAAMSGSLKLVAERRNGHIKSLGPMVDRVEFARRRHAEKERDRDWIRSQVDDARKQRNDADEKFAQEGIALLAGWEAHLSKLRRLRPEDIDAMLLELATWVASPSGDNPAEHALQISLQGLRDTCARERAELNIELKNLTDEKEVLKPKGPSSRTANLRLPPFLSGARRPRATDAPARRCGGTSTSTRT